MIEDEIFASALDTMGIKRTKDMYIAAEHPHTCTMCGEDYDPQAVGYKLKREYVDNLNTPYLWICNECYEELPNES